MQRKPEPEIARTLDLVRNFWPDLEVPKDANATIFGKSDFIIKFYTAFIAEINDKVLYLINEEMFADEFDDIQDLVPHLLLYLRSAKMLRKMKQNLFYLIDLFIPNTKKMCPLVTMSTHFVIYINNLLDELFIIINDYLRKVGETEDLKVTKQKLLEESASIAEKNGRVITAVEDLKKHLEETKNTHAKMLELKAIDDGVLAKKTTEVTILQAEIDNLEYQKQSLEDTEKELSESLFTEHEYKTLRQTEAYLQIEYQKLDNESDAADSVEKEYEDVKKYEEFAKLFSQLRVDTLDSTVTKLHEIKQEMSMKEQNLKDLTEQLKVLKNSLTIHQKNEEELKEKLKAANEFKENQYKKITEEQRNEEKLKVAAIQKTIACFEEQQRVETQCIVLDEKIQNIQADTCKLYEMAAREYQRILSMDKEATNAFYDTMLQLKKGSDEVEKRLI